MDTKSLRKGLLKMSKNELVSVMIDIATAKNDSIQDSIEKSHEDTVKVLECAVTGLTRIRDEMPS